MIVYGEVLPYTDGHPPDLVNPYGRSEPVFEDSGKAKIPMGWTDSIRFISFQKGRRTGCACHQKAQKGQAPSHCR
jgi:hypothetical protein